MASSSCVLFNDQIKFCPFGWEDEKPYQNRGSVHYDILFGVFEDGDSCKIVIYIGLTSATEVPPFYLKLVQKSQISEAKTSSALQLVEQDLLVLQDRIL